MSLRSTTYNIIKGKFLVEGDSLKNWVFIVYITFLALVMISSGHKVDRKVQEIAKLSKNQKELRALHIATRSQLMKLKMETSIVKAVEIKGLKVSLSPPVQIKITKVEE